MGLPTGAVTNLKHQGWVWGFAALVSWELPVLKALSTESRAQWRPSRLGRFADSRTNTSAEPLRKDLRFSDLGAGRVSVVSLRMLGWIQEETVPWEAVTHNHFYWVALRRC